MHFILLVVAHLTLLMDVFYKKKRPVFQPVVPLLKISAATTV